MEELLKGIFDRNGRSKKVKVLKFGGKSLANGEGLDSVLRIGYRLRWRMVKI